MHHWHPLLFIYAKYDETVGSIDLLLILLSNAYKYHPILLPSTHRSPEPQASNQFRIQQQLQSIDLQLQVEMSISFITADMSTVVAATGLNFPEVVRQQEPTFQKRKVEVGNHEKNNSFQIDRSTSTAAWSSILESKKMEAGALPPPYIHPLLRRQSGFLSQKSLEICTESLVSETGSDGFSDIGDMLKQVEMEKVILDCDVFKGSETKKELAVVNYHGSSTTNKLFPPPLPSISRRDGQCVLMKQHRKDGRLVVHTTPVPSKNYLHCQREGGRLHLSFIETNFKEIYPEIEDPVVTKQKQVAEMEEKAAETDYEVEEEDEEEGEEEMAGMEVEEDDEEEVEVVDRGNVVEVKVSCLPQLLPGGMKVHRSSLVINKFVGSGMPHDETPMAMETSVLAVESTNTNTTAQLGDTPASTVAEVECWGSGQNLPASTPADNKLLFSSKKMMNRQALLHRVRRCGEYHRPLFFWEPGCIARS